MLSPKITPNKAAKAIDNFLTGVEPWDFLRPKGTKIAEIPPAVMVQ